MDEKIFISYSRKDKEKVFALVDRIEKELKIKCWIDLDGIESGQQFADVIMNAIEHCEIVLFMMSDNSLNSSYAKKEINYAHLLKRKIVPIVLDDKELRGWFAFEFGTADYIVAEDDEQMAKLFRNLRSWLPDIVPAVEEKVEPHKVSLKVLSNCDCKILVDCDEVGFAAAGRLFKHQLPVGEYYIEFISVDNPEDRLSYDVILEHDKLMKIMFEIPDEHKEEVLEIEEVEDTLVIEEIDEPIEIESYSEQPKVVPCLHKKLIGFASLQTGKVVISGKYDDVSKFSEGLAAVRECCDTEHKWGYVDYEGIEVIPCQFQNGRLFSEGLAAVCKEGKWGYIDKSGKVVIDYTYDDAYSFSEGLAHVNIGGDNYYIDKNGKKVIKLQYDKFGFFADGMASVCRGDKWGYIDKSGKEVIPCIFDEANDYINGRAVVKNNGKSGVINRTGDIIIPFVESCSIYRQYDGLVVEERVGKFKGRLYYDSAGQEILSKRGEVVGYGDDVITFKKYDRYGCVDKEDNILIPLQYDEATSFYEGLLAVKKGDCWGYVDKSNKVVIPFVFEEAWEFSNGYAEVKFNGKMGVIDKTGAVIIPFKYHDITDPFNYSDIADCYMDNWREHWLVDKLGNSLNVEDLGSHYSRYGEATHDWVPIISAENKIGYADKYSGEITIPCVYGYAVNFHDDLAWAYIPELGAYGCIELDRLFFTIENGTEVDRFYIGDYAAYRIPEKGKCGYLDRFGKKVIQFSDDMSLGPLDYVAPVWNKESAWLIDKSGSKISDLYDSIDSLFHDELIMVKKKKGLLGLKTDSKCGYLDQKGKLVIPLKYDDACPFSEGIASVKMKDKWGCIDKEGKVVKQFIYDWIGPFKEGLATVQIGSKYGFVDHYKLVIPMTSGSALDFSEGLACVMSNESGKYGYINRKGVLVIPHQFDEASSFSCGLAKVKQNDLWGYIDYWGRIVIPCEYEYVEDFIDGLAYVQKDGKYGYINKKGDEVVACRHDSLTNTLVEYGIAVNSDKGYMVDRFGNECPLPSES